MLTLVVTSDTHGAHDALEVPDGDVFIHAGDSSNMGDLAQIEAAAAWIQALPLESTGSAATFIALLSIERTDA